VKRYEPRRANNISAIQQKPLTFLVLRGIRRLKAKRVTFATTIGEAGGIHSANKKFPRIFLLRCASPIGGVRIAGPILLAQHKENEIGKAGKTKE
jgi:hypothetical protein